MLENILPKRTPLYQKHYRIVNYYAALFLYAPHIYNIVNPSLGGKMLAKPRKIVSAPGGSPYRVVKVWSL